MIDNSQKKISEAASPGFSDRVAQESLARLVYRAHEVLAGCGNEFSQSLARLDSLSARLQEGRFHLAVLGQFKRGKSTLLNALLGGPILPISVIPLTAIPTFIKWGPQTAATVIFNRSKPAEKFHGGEVSALADFLAGFVAEERNPENKLDVSQVDVEYPSSILQEGVVLIDTPGIGSTFKHNTEATLNFLPQCDAALFIVSPDPPITEVEVEFLKEVQSKISCLFFVFNKADYLTDQELEQSISFLQGVLENKAGISNGLVIFRVSALKGLKAKLAGSNAEWEASGLDRIEKHMINFLAQNKKRALEEAIARKSQAVLQDSVMRLQLEIQSLKMPLERLEERMKLLNQRLDAARYQRVLEGDMLEGDKKRSIEQLEERADELRKKAYSQLSEIIHNFVLLKKQVDEKLIQEKLRKTIPVFFEHAFGEMSRAFEKEMINLLRGHQERIEELVQSIRKDAAEIFEIPYVPVEQLETLELEKAPHWVTHYWNDSFGLPSEGFIDGFLPGSIRRRRVLKRADEIIDSLVVQNVENVRWSTLQILNDTFRNFGDLIDKKLAEAVAATKEAIDAAYLQRRERSEGVNSELVRLDTIQKQLISISDRLESFLKSLGRKEN